MWEDVARDWGIPYNVKELTGYERDDVIKAYKESNRILGSRWWLRKSKEKFYDEFHLKGDPHFIRFVVPFTADLLKLESCKGFDYLKNNLVGALTDLSSKKSSLSNLNEVYKAQIAASLRRDGLNIEIDPRLLSGKSADLFVEFEATRVYLELKTISWMADWEGSLENQVRNAFKKASGQLSGEDNNPRLIIIQISRTIDELLIRKIIQSMLKPNLNRSISAVLVVARRAEIRKGKREVEPFKIRIEHPNPKNRLDAKLCEMIPFSRSLALTYPHEI